jgi:hypothetical protein
VFVYHTFRRIISYLLIYLLRVARPLDKLVKKFPAFYGTRRLLTAFGRSRHLSMSRARSIQSMLPHPTSWRPILILSSTSGSSNWSLSLRFAHQILCASLLSYVRATFPAHLILDLISRKILGEEYNLLSSSLCSFLDSPVSTSLLGPNILFSTLFSDNLSLRSSLNVSDQFSHPYRTTRNIIVLYILIFIFLDRKLENKSFCTEWYQMFPYFNLLLISSWIEFWYVRLVPKYLNSSTLSKEQLSLSIWWLSPLFWSRAVAMDLVLSA